METINIKNLHFYFKSSHKIISNFNLVCSAGEVVHLTGHSGIGKSTLASLMAGHLKPVSGSIYVNNEKLTGPSRRVFVVHQENDLFPWLTIKNHLEFLKNEDLKLGIPKEDDFLKELEMFSLAASAALYPNEISGGMKRRLAILRGMLLKPQVLILDESLSSLNKDLKIEIMDVLKKFITLNNMTLLLIDHNASDLKTFIDRTIEL